MWTSSRNVEKVLGRTIDALMPMKKNSAWRTTYPGYRLVGLEIYFEQLGGLYLIADWPGICRFPLGSGVLSE